MSNDLQGGAIVAATDVLNEERVITYPTETVSSIGCGPDNEAAMMRLLGLKQRPADKGLILVAASYEQLKPYIDDTMLTDTQREAIFSRWPGPVTFVLPASVTTLRWPAGRFDSFAIRVTDHPLVVTLYQTYGRPLVSTSTGLNGLPPCRTVDEVRAQFDAAFPVVSGETGGHLNSSKIRDALTGKLFRQG